MRFHAALATGADLEAACRAAAAEVRRALGDGGIDLVVVFASTRYGADIDRLPVLLHELLQPRTLVGCSGGAVVAGPQACEGRHAISLLAGRLPGVHVDAAAIATADLPDADAGPAAWRALLPPRTAEAHGMLVLCEPFHFDVNALLAGLDFAFPRIPKAGGVASGSRHPEGHSLFLGRHAHRTGAVVVALGGDIALETVVAQGCRPIGRRGRVTRADRSRLLAVDDAPVQKFIESQLGSLSAEDMTLADESPLFLGIATDPFSEPSEAGDYLVRNVLGFDREGALVVAGELGIGRQVQLHLRDRRSGTEDLERRLRRVSPARSAAALLFRCLGRAGPDHEQFAQLAPGVPLAGFHCNGEIGTLGEGTYLHGYTAAFALLRPRDGASAR